MVPPVYALEAWLGRQLSTDSDALVLLLIFGVLDVALPLALGVAAAWLSLRVSGAVHRGRQLAGRDGIRVVLARYAPAVVPLGFAIWFAHYMFHFATGALTALPVLQSFLIDHGLAVLGTEPNWALGPVLPAAWLFPLEAITVAIGFLASTYVLYRIAFTAHASDRAARRAAMPWLALLVLLALAATAIFFLPMEMRGSAGFVG
jgi:hypothetical protein